MFEAHGWAVIEASPSGDDDAKKAEVTSKLRAKVASDFSMPAYAAHVDEVFNGRTVLTLTTCRNHRRDEIIELFEWLGRQAPGSFGLLYVNDDEDHNRGGDYQNEWRVWRLVRGQLTEHADPFLSPYIPTLEDPYKPEANGGTA